MDLKGRKKEMANRQITVTARIKAREGMAEKVRGELMALLAPTRSEPGCINYVLHQADDDNGEFMFYENWTDKEALDKHLAMPYLKAFIARADELLAEPLDVTLWEIVS